jgi:Tol biopolymer transport system component
MLERFPDEDRIVARGRSRLESLRAPETGISERLAWEPALDTMGAPSPDGRRISFVNWDNGNLAVHDLQTGENRDLTEEGTWIGLIQWADVSTWSPDGERLAYVWWRTVPHEGEEHQYAAELRIIGLDDPAPTVLLADPDVIYPQPYGWSADGRKILVGLHKERSSGEPDELALVSIEDGSVRVLRSLPPELRDSTLALSPDGRFVVYGQPSGETAAPYDVFLLAVDGSVVRRLVDHPAADFAPVWTPDGRSVVFVSTRGGSAGLWILDVIDGERRGEPRLLKANVGQARPMGITPDGRLFYWRARSNSNVFSVELDPETGLVTSPPTKLVRRFEGYNAKPSWSPNGTQLAYAYRRPDPANGTMSRVLVIQSMETGEQRDLALPLEGVLASQATSPRWSPDGLRLLLNAHSGRGGGFEACYSLDLRSGETTIVVEDLSWPHYRWSRDGEGVIHVAPIDGRNQLRVRDLGTGEDRVLAEAARIVGSTETPDGTQIAYVEEDWSRSSHGSVIKLMPSSGGPARALTRLDDGKLTSITCGIEWTADGRYLLIGRCEPDEGPVDIHRVAVDTGETVPIGLSFRNLRNLSVHPDGRRLAFTGATEGHYHSVWVMENFLPGGAASR